MLLQQEGGVQERGAPVLTHSGNTLPGGLEGVAAKHVARRFLSAQDLKCLVFSLISAHFKIQVGLPEGFAVEAWACNA